MRFRLYAIVATWCLSGCGGGNVATDNPSTSTVDMPNAPASSWRIEDFAGAWKNDRYALTLNADGNGTIVSKDPGFTTTTQADISKSGTVFKLSYLEPKSFTLRNWEVTLSQDRTTLQMAGDEGSEKLLLRKAK